MRPIIHKLAVLVAMLIAALPASAYDFDYALNGDGSPACSDATVKSRAVSTSLSGAGTQESPYIIASAADLRYLSDKVNEGNTFYDKYFKQTSNIVINSGSYDSDDFKNQELWIPIGKDSNHTFRGTYDGDNHVISGICIIDNKELYDSFEYFGLFGITSSASILNLSVDNIFIDISGEVGTITGKASGESSAIENCHTFNGYVKGEKAAGIAYEAVRKTIKNCSNNISVYATENAGGIVGVATSSYFYNCINAGHIEGSSIGGIYNTGNSLAYNCYNAGELKSPSGEVAGILRLATVLTISARAENCVNYGKLYSDAGGSMVAALVYKTSGSKTISIYDCFYIKEYKAISSGVKQNNVNGISESEMKSASTLEALNKSDNELYSKWVAGSDGFPTFEWYKDLLLWYNDYSSGVEDVRYDKISDVNFNDLPETTPIAVYNLSGVCIYNGQKINMPQLGTGYYIVTTPNKSFKLYM